MIDGYEGGCLRRLWAIVQGMDGKLCTLWYAATIISITDQSMDLRRDTVSDSTATRVQYGVQVREGPPVRTGTQHSREHASQSTAW